MLDFYGRNDLNGSGFGKLFAGGGYFVGRAYFIRKVPVQLSGNNQKRTSL